MKKLIFLLIIAKSFTTCCLASDSHLCHENKKNFDSAISSIEFTSMSTKDKINIAARLPNMVEKIQPCHDADESVVNSLSTLLTNNEDSVVFFASVALGGMGKKAMRAIPNLKKALIRARRPVPDRIGPDLGADVAIESAINSIEHSENMGQ